MTAPAHSKPAAEAVSSPAIASASVSSSTVVSLRAVALVDGPGGVIVPASPTGSSAAPLPDITVVKEAAPLTSSRLAAVTADAVRIAQQSYDGGLLSPAIPVSSLAASPTATPTPSATGTPTVTPTPSKPDCDPTQSPLYCVYTVGDGDTLGKIATRFGLKSSGDIANWDLLVQSNRPDILNGDAVIQPGQKVRIPNDTGVIHLVLTGESVADIAKAFGVSPGAVIGSDGPLDASQPLTLGSEILIKNPQQLPATVVGIAPTPIPDTPTPTPAATSTPTPAPTQAATAVPTKAAAVATATATAGLATFTPVTTAQQAPATSGRKTGFVWPATGPISSYFGPSHPLGIDIDLFKQTNAPIAAAAGGVVTFAGGNSCCSYGYYVVIDHGNGYTTLYAHLSKFNVAAGQKVNQGDVLGIGGRTGNATGIHLHFEVHYKGNVIDPLSVLP